MYKRYVCGVDPRGRGVEEVVYERCRRIWIAAVGRRGKGDAEVEGKLAGAGMRDGYGVGIVCARFEHGAADEVGEFGGEFGAQLGAGEAEGPDVFGGGEVWEGVGGEVETE